MPPQKGDSGFSICQIASGLRRLTENQNARIANGQKNAMQQDTPAAWHFR